MTIAEQFKQEGMQQGHQEAIRQIAAKMLKQGQDAHQISQLTDLSEEEVLSLKDISEKEALEKD